MKYTVVQHSGCGFGGKMGFAQGIESKSISEKDEERVKRAGGLVFDSYKDAEKFCEIEAYPEGYGGLYPRAPGTFSKTVVGGLKVYVPKREE